MNIYLIMSLLATGICSRLSYGNAVNSINQNAFSVENFEVLEEKDLKRNYLGFLLGTLVLITSLLATYIYHKDWMTLVYLAVTLIISMIIYKVLHGIMGGHLSRILFIWLFPILGSIYLIFFLIQNGNNL